MSNSEHASYVHEVELPTLITPRSSNRLLASLSRDDHERIAPHLIRVPVRPRQMLFKQDASIEGVFFPGGGSCALVKTTEDGRTAQIADVGAEGAIGASVFFGMDRYPTDVVVHTAGPAAEVLPAAIFSREMERRGALYNRVIRYNQALMSELMQSTACNGLHSVTQRCARWILTAHDRAETDEFSFTHDYAATMLGVRRPTVTLIAGHLQAAGVIEYRRGMLRVVNREGLEAAACSCYHQVRRTFKRLLPEVTAPAAR